MKTIAVLITILAAASFNLQAADAKANWEQHCAKCHGAEGKGDTKMGQKLKVRDYTDAKVQAEMKDEAMAKAIKEGVKEGDKSVMKAYGDVLKADEIKALVEHVRKLKK